MTLTRHPALTILLVVLALLLGAAAAATLAHIGRARADDVAVIPIDAGVVALPPAPTVTEPRTPLPPLPPLNIPPAVAPTPARRGYTADEWVRIIAELSVAIGAIGGLIVTITGNRAAAARDAAAARAAELRAEQLRAVATRVDAPVIAVPQPPASGAVEAP